MSALHSNERNLHLRFHRSYTTRLGRWLFSKVPEDLYRRLGGKSEQLKSPPSSESLPSDREIFILLRSQSC